MTDKNHLLGYVLASEYRKKVMLSLQEKPLTPVAMANETELHTSHVSNTLAELTKEKLVVCLTPKLRKGRLYELTKTGNMILKQIT